MHVITSVYDGDVAIYEATLENANTILSWQVVPEEVKAFAAARPPKYATYDTIAAIVNKILKANDGDTVFTSKHDSTQTIVATPETKQEVVMYLFKHGILPDHVNAYCMWRYDAHKELKCLSHFHDMDVVDEWVASWANTYSTIVDNKWKDGVSDLRKIQYILNFANELADRHQKYIVEEVKAVAR